MKVLLRFKKNTVMAVFKEAPITGLEKCGSLGPKGVLHNST